MLGNGRNQGDVYPRAVDRESLTNNRDELDHLDLSLSLSCHGSSGNVRSTNSSVIPPVGACRPPNTNVRTQDMTMGSFGMGTFLIGRARARARARASIDHWRRDSFLVERESGLTMVYPITYTAATTTVAVHTAWLHGRVLGHAMFATGPTGSGYYICPPFMIIGSTNAPPVPIPSQSGFNHHRAPYVPPSLRSNNPVPMYATSGAAEHPLVVTTTGNGNGPNERPIYGIIVGQGALGEMYIMCACHGIILSPAAFVEHAGGTSSGQPMERIVACMRPIPF